MGRAQRSKGNRGELQVRDIFRAHGFDVARVPNSGGLHIPGDLDGLDGFHVEVKYHERPSIRAWIAQAQSDCPDGDEPLLFWRTSHMRWRADVDADWLVGLLAELDHLRQEGNR